MRSRLSGVGKEGEILNPMRKIRRLGRIVMRMIRSKGVGKSTRKIMRNWVPTITNA